MRWWGWGAPDTRYDLESRPRFLPWLDAQLGLSAPPAVAPVDPDAIAWTPSRLSREALDALVTVVGEINASTQARERLTHTHGKGYVDLLRARAGRFEGAPDAVVYPTQEAHILEVLELARQHDFQVVPFGGGTSVVGGLRPDRADRPFVSLDLSRLDAVLSVDPISLTARIQAGILGPRLEEELLEHGLTLGHYPQSFEFSSLGGWIATRSSGQRSTRYGAIADLVESVRLVTPSGVVEARSGPEAPPGPDWRQVVIGSEGTLGVISEAVVRLRRAPDRRQHRALLFPSWEQGLEAVRRLSQGDRPPAVVRLSDAVETEAFGKLREAKGAAPGAAWVQRWVQWYLARVRGIRAGAACLLVLGFEGKADEVEQDLAAARHCCESLRAFDLGAGVGEAWHAGRFNLPYLRDLLLDRGCFLETFETGVTWSGAAAVEGAVRKAVDAAVAADGKRGLLLLHVSHPSRHGACLYFTLVTEQVRGDEEGQFTRYKQAITSAIVAAGGSLSHHHAVGSDHAPWLRQAAGAGSVSWWSRLKAEVDPSRVMPSRAPEST